MIGAEKWIWLDEKKYPEYQTTCLYKGFQEFVGGSNFTVAEFQKEYCFEEEAVEVQLRFSGDTAFELYLNQNFLAAGPVNVGGDFLFNDEVRSKHYASELTVYPNQKKLHFFARVKMMPVALNEYSHGRGGFMLWAKVRLKNGRIRYLTTDTTWLGRRNHAYIDSYTYDQGRNTDGFTNARRVDNIWHAETAPIKLCKEQKLYPIEDRKIIVKPGESKKIRLEFEKICGGFVCVDVKAQGKVKLDLTVMETETILNKFYYDLTFEKEDHYRGLQLNSIGLYSATIENHSTEEAELEFFMIGTHYPVEQEAKTITSDKDLNLVLDVCRHTLKYCRQMIHLDSPQHCEPLACTGDYYIESLMTAMSFGDMSLAEFDILRTAELLRMHDGRMYYATYSMIWVLMLWDVYMLTAHESLLEECEDALSLLLERFETYIGENGLIETPPDFMFVDWIYLDNISMFHPPKALGQTCLCAFYYGALKAAEKIYEVLGETAESTHCIQKAEKLRAAMNELLYDPEKGLYFEGLNTPVPEELLYEHMPQNVEKRYYLQHSNILCTCFGVCDDETAEKILKQVVEGKELGDCQPYFKHFLLEAIYNHSLCEKYTLKVVEEWKAPIKECPKGLVEGFVKPEPAYSFDHSHAWGGTPLYSVPKALLGLEILEPGYRRISISPKLLGLESAHIEVPTPYGMMRFELQKGKCMQMEIPKEIQVEMR